MGKELDFSALPEDRLRSTIAGLQIIARRANDLIGQAKAEYMRGHDEHDSEDMAFGGRTVGTVSISAEGRGSWRVADPVAFANALHDAGVTLPGGDEAWEDVHYPRPEAMRSGWIDGLVKDHGGEIPEGVEYRPGRASTVSVRLDRGVVDGAFDAPQMRTIGAMLKPLPGEAGQ